MHHCEESVTETSSQTWECLTGAHEQTELIGWIELNRDNSTIEDKAIPRKATDNRMLRGRTGNKRQSLATLASTACTNKVMNQAACLPPGANVDLILQRMHPIFTHDRKNRTTKPSADWDGAVRSAWGRRKEPSWWMRAWGRRREGLFPPEPRWEMKQYCGWLGSRLSEGTDSSGWLWVYENSGGCSRDGCF